MKPFQIPNSIQIAGQKIKIRVGKLENAYGQYEHEDRTIWISEHIKSNKTKLETIRHEMMEATLLLSGVGWSEKFEAECVVRCMEEIFFPAYERLKKALARLNP